MYYLKLFKKSKIFFSLFFILLMISCNSEIKTKLENEKVRKESISKDIENLIDELLSVEIISIEKEKNKVFNPFSLILLLGKDEIEKKIKTSDKLLRLIRNYEETIDNDLINVIGKYNFYKPRITNSRKLYIKNFNRENLINFCDQLHYTYFSSLIFSNFSRSWINGKVTNKFSHESIKKSKSFLNETISKSKFMPLLSSKGGLTPFTISWKDESEIILYLCDSQINADKWIKKDYGNNFYVSFPFKMKDIRIENFDYSKVEKLLSYEGTANSLTVRVNVLETKTKILPSLYDMAENGLFTYINNNNFINDLNEYQDFNLNGISGLKQTTINRSKDSLEQKFKRQSILLKNNNKYWDITFEHPKDNFLDNLISEKIISTLEFSN